MNAYATENEIKESVLEYLRTIHPSPIVSIENRLEFEIKTEYTIYLGRKRCRADATLLLNKKPIILVECKRHGQADEGIEQLKSYICGSVAHLGIFANSVDLHKWTFLEMSNVLLPFIYLNRVTFEEQVLIACQTEHETQEKIRLRSNHLINVEARKRATESKIRQETQRIIRQEAKARATESEIQSEVERQLRTELQTANREHGRVESELNTRIRGYTVKISDLKEELRKVRGYLWTALIVTFVILIIVLNGWMGDNR